MFAHSLTIEVGIGSRLHDLVGEKILRISPSDTGSMEDRALLLLLGIVREISTDDCSGTLMIFIILSMKKCPKVLARSVGLKGSGKMMVEDLCKIFC